jgi:hypothetical protein
MAYLDLTPMTHALRAAPGEFELAGGSVYHLPSRHSVHFDAAGKLILAGECDCTLLEIDHAQAAEMWEAVEQWRMQFWEPLQINKDFAGHFGQASLIRRTLIAFTGRIHRALLTGSTVSKPPLFTPAFPQVVGPW